MRNEKSIVVFLVFLAFAATAYFIFFGGGQNKDDKIYRIGLLQMASTVNANIDGFKEGMQALGYQEGKNVIYIYRNAEGNSDLIKKYAKELVDQKVDLIFSDTSPATQAAKEATAGTDVPVVFSMVADPVGAGFVQSIQSSGNNLAGTSCAYIDIAPKRLEFLKEAFPQIKRMLVYYKTGDKSGEPAAEALVTAGKKLGITIIKKPVSGSEEIKNALKNLSFGETDALMDPADVTVTVNVDSLLAAASRLKIPLLMMSDLEAEKGALFAYGVDYADLGRQSSPIADKILRGTKPSEIPIEMPRIFRIVINLKTAAQMGFTIPDGIITRADRIIR